jgi:hypothetical protein
MLVGQRWHAFLSDGPNIGNKKTRKNMNSCIDKSTRFLRLYVFALFSICGLVASLFVLSSCGGGGSGGSGTSSQQPSTGASLAIVQVDNAASPVIAAVTDNTRKEKFALIGTKDSSGVPLSVTQALYISASGNASTLTIGPDGLPENLSDAAGNKITFANFTNSTMDITLFDPAGNQVAGPITVNVDPAVLANLRASVGTLTSPSAQGSPLVSGLLGISSLDWILGAVNTMSTAYGVGGCASMILTFAGTGSFIPVGGTAVGAVVGAVGCGLTLIDFAQQVKGTNNPLVTYSSYGEGSASCVVGVVSRDYSECTGIALSVLPPIVKVVAPPPSVPTNLTVSAVQQNQVRFYWTGSTDDVAITGYRVYRDGGQIADVGGVLYTDQNVTPGTQYCYTVMAHDANGNSSGESNQLCVTIPRATLFVSSTTPVSGASGVSVSSAVFTTFNVAIDTSSLNTSAFTITGPSGLVTGTVSYNAATNSAVFTPTVNLAYAATYTANVTTGVKNLSGNPLASNYSWNFTTASNSGGVTPPTTTTTPAPSIITSSLLSATVGTAYAQSVVASGGQKPYNWSVSSGLPNGLSINATTGSISGTPSVSGTFNFTVTATDSSSPKKTASQGLSLTVVQPTSTSPGNFTVTGTPYCETTHGTPTGAVLLEWGQSSTATNYDIIRDGATIATGVTDLGARNTSSDLTGQSHSYVIRAHNSSTTTTDSNGGVAITVTVPPNVCASSVTSAPTVSSISPSTVTGSSSSTTFTVSGSNFASGAKVQVGYASNGYTFTNTSTNATYVNTSTLTVPITTQTQANTWRVRVINPDGQTSSGYVSLVVNAPADTTLPSIAISSPVASGGTYSTGTATVNVSGTASDNVGVTMIIWDNNRGGGGTASGTTNWSASGIALQSGSNVITVDVYDAAGNTKTTSITVNYSVADTTLPSIAISSPVASGETFSTGNATVTVSGTATDNVGVVSVYVANNRGSAQFASGLPSWTATGIALQTGANILTAHAIDAAGNDATTSITVNYSLTGYVSQGGLTWMPVTFGRTLNWPDANAYCTGTIINGQTGWRMPTQAELLNLYSSGAMNNQSWWLYGTWSSTPAGSGNHYRIDLAYGDAAAGVDVIGYAVSCVR